MRPSSRPCWAPRPAATPADAARLYDLVVAEPETSGELDDALAGEAGMIVVRTDRRRNLELHRELSEAAAAAMRAPSTR